MILSVRNKNVLDCTTVPVKTTFIPNYFIPCSLEFGVEKNHTQHSDFLRF